MAKKHNRFQVVSNNSAEMVLSQLGENEYTAYSLETGFLVHGDWRKVSHAMEAQGLAKDAIPGMYQALHLEKNQKAA